MIASTARIYRSALRLLVPPLMLSIASFGQSTGSPKPIPDTVELVRIIHSDSDVDVLRTPCQRVRDLFDHSGVAHDVTGERPAVCDHVLDIVAGQAEPTPITATQPIRPAKVASDSRHRILVTEPTTRTVHILDFENRKYTRIDGAKNERMLFPYGVAVDADDNLYVTDLKRGIIVVFSADGKFKRNIGRYKDEGIFQSPNSIAIDRASGRIYVADTERHLVVILNRDGKDLGHIGKRGGGTGPEEFRFPTELALHGDELFVLDRKNERMQVFDLAGHYRREFKPGNLDASSVKGIAIDARGWIYALHDFDTIEVFDSKGQPQSRIGHFGTEPGEFSSSQGISIDSSDHLYITDTGNRRVQVFQINKPRVVRASTAP
jgi:DNA-binding beta-propeller fold protein YncE